jgi:hypothetical protein
MHVSQNALVMLSAGVIAGALLTAGMLSAQKRGAAPAAAADSAGIMEPPFELVDTPGSTFLLNRASGEVWRIGFTEVKGERHWFGTFVPVQQPVSFEEFQQRLRRQLEGN